MHFTYIVLYARFQMILDSQDTYKTYSKKDKGMLRNIDDSTRIESGV